MSSPRFALLPLALTLLCAPASAAWTPVPAGPAPADNPLRGFMPYQGSDGNGFPHSLEYQYLAMKDLMTGPASFDFAPLEALLGDVASRGNQTVFRVYLDYPDCCPDGSYASGVPAFLTTGPGAVTFTAYPEHGGGSSPDYDNERLLVAIEDLVAALGAAYDGDPRLGFVQVGFVGMWGEWHTYPYNGEDTTPDLMPSLAAQARVLAAFGDAFDATPLLVSQDAMDQFAATTPCGPTGVCPADFAADGIGFHDDNFAVGTYDATDNQDWYFQPKLVDRGLDSLWREQPIGGEIQPTIQEDVFTAAWDGQDFDAAVDAVHATFLLDQFAFEPDADPDRAERTLAAAARLGYELRITEADVPAAADETSLTVGIRVVNLGVAPFYGTWPVTVTLLDGAAVAASWHAPWDLRTILPGEPATELTATFPHALAPGTYRLALRVANPLAGGKDLRFANAGYDGPWLVLGDITVGGLVFADGFESGDTSAW